MSNLRLASVVQRLDFGQHASHFVEEGHLLRDLGQRELHLSPDVARYEELVRYEHSLSHAGHLSETTLSLEKLNDTHLL